MKLDFISKSIVRTLTNWFLTISLFAATFTSHSLAANTWAITQEKNLSDYSLVGVAYLDGISYASLVDRQSNEHFVLTTGKPDQGFTLTSLTKDFDAVIEYKGQSVILKLGEGKATVASTALSQSIFPQTNFVVPTHLAPPSGGTLPLVFQPVDAKTLNLSEEQQATFNRLRQDFVQAIGRNGSSASSQATDSSDDKSLGTTDAQRLKNWKTAQKQSDEQFKMLFGTEAFNLYQMELSHESNQQS